MKFRERIERAAILLGANLTPTLKQYRLGPFTIGREVANYLITSKGEALLELIRKKIEKNHQQRRKTYTDCECGTLETTEIQFNPQRQQLAVTIRETIDYQQHKDTLLKASASGFREEVSGIEPTQQDRCLWFQPEEASEKLVIIIPGRGVAAAHIAEYMKKLSVECGGVNVVCYDALNPQSTSIQAAKNGLNAFLNACAVKYEPAQTQIVGFSLGGYLLTDALPVDKTYQHIHLTNVPQSLTAIAEQQLLQKLQPRLKNTVSPLFKPSLPFMHHVLEDDLQRHLGRGQAISVYGHDQDEMLGCKGLYSASARIESGFSGSLTRHKIDKPSSEMSSLEKDLESITDNVPKHCRDDFQTLCQQLHSSDPNAYKLHPFSRVFAQAAEQIQQRFTASTPSLAR